ncbi:MAG TPA: YihY/virulence factor BrkB family protein [Bryobacteraceae bacterium]|jgi:membrane protein|nr:YihY/virulence factor BrkB family protein [Bryobacteraceae bacterium]
MEAKEFWSLTKITAVRWNDYNAPRLGAALAYYSLLSLAPLMLLAVYICGLVFGAKTAEARIVHEAIPLLGPKGARTLEMVINNAHKQSAGIFASSVAILLLFFGASSLFVELQSQLNTIWDAPPKNSSVLKGMASQRLTSFGMVLGVGILLLASLFASTALALVEKFFGGIVPISPILLEILDVGVFTITVATLFALIFKFVPDVRIDWEDVGVGALVTALLFLGGKTLLALYLATAGVGSTYGAAGSLVALVVWVYYSAQIFLFGAIFTRVYASAFGSRRRRGRPKQELQGTIHANPGA